MYKNRTKKLGIEIERIKNINEGYNKTIKDYESIREELLRKSKIPKENEESIKHMKEVIKENSDELEAKININKEKFI